MLFGGVTASDTEEVVVVIGLCASKGRPLGACLAVVDLAVRRMRALYSRLSSLVSKAEHVLSLNSRSLSPSNFVTESKTSSVASLCKRNLASPCK